MAAMRRPGRVAGAAGFVVPLLALLVIWEAVVRAFDQAALPPFVSARLVASEVNATRSQSPETEMS